MQRVGFSVEAIERMLSERAEWEATPEGRAQAEKARAAEEQFQRDQRESLTRKNLDGADDLRVTDAVRTALVSGSGLRETPSLSAVRAWVSDRSALPWLVLAGTTGVGKSVAAAWATAAYGGTWVRAEKLCRIFWANFGDSFERQEQIANSRFLVLDDVGSESDRERMTQTLVELLDARKSRSHRTIVTTNLDRAAFRERYSDARLLSRMAEQALFVGDVGDDLRRRK